MTRMSTHRAGKRMRRLVSTLLSKAHMDACDVTMKWDSAAPESGDETSYEEPNTLEACVRALVHFVDARTVLRQGAEFMAGDVILTLPESVRLDRAALRFVLPNGHTYVQRDTGRDYEQFWDAIFDGRPVGKTLLLRVRP